MVISALVLTLPSEAVQQAVVERALAGFAQVTVGSRNGCALPVVTEADDAASGAALCESIAALAGVLHVDVVRIDFLDEPAALTSARTPLPVI